MALKRGSAEFAYAIAGWGRPVRHCYRQATMSLAGYGLLLLYWLPVEGVAPVILQPLSPFEGELQGCLQLCPDIIYENIYLFLGMFQFPYLISFLLATHNICIDNVIFHYLQLFSMFATIKMTQ